MDMNEIKEEKTQFYKEKNGQYSFLDVQPIINTYQKEDDLLLFIQNSYKKALELNVAKEEYQKLEKSILEEEIKKKYKFKINQLFIQFIKEYFLNFNRFPHEELLKKYENFSNYYHVLGKLFLFYLYEFVYNQQTEQIFDEDLAIQMENFIEADSIKYRDPYYVSILKTELQEHKKLRVNSYILYHLQPFLEKMKQIFSANVQEEMELIKIGKRKETGNQLYSEIKKLQEDHNLQTTIFKQSKKFIPEENQDILVVLFLKYLEYCVYFDSFAYPDEKSKSFVAEIENFVIFHFHNTVCLSVQEEKVYSIAMKQVAKHLSTYVKKEGQNLNVALKEYDALERFKNSSQYKMIAYEEKKNDLPTLYSKEDLQFKMKTFLENVFLLSKDTNKKRSPLFLEGFEAERNRALKLGLEYLDRFIYSISEEESFDDDFVKRLENLLASCDFHVKEGHLCSAKSILYKRVNVRNVLQDVTLRRKVLKYKES